MSEQREFKGIWIPAEIWLDERLDALEKVIFAEIDSLSSCDRKCIKSNSTFAKFCQCSESKVSRAISKLVELGYVEQLSFDGRTRTLQSCLGYLPRQERQNDEADKAICLHSNTYSNPVENNKEKDKKKKADSGFDKIIAEYTTDLETTKLIWEWIDGRKKNKKPPTENALRLALKKIDGMAKESGMTVNHYLEEVIIRGWIGFYPIKNFQNYGNPRPAPEPAPVQVEPDQGKHYF